MRIPLIMIEMPPETPTATCCGASTSAIAGVTLAVTEVRMDRRVTSPTATGRTSGCRMASTSACVTAFLTRGINEAIEAAP